MSSSFFESFVNHPDLHSFPTRRSSDLPLQFQADDLVDLAVPRGPHDHRHAGTGSGDRKSTRLNSSHTGTPYALCRSKKKTSTAYRETHSSSSLRVRSKERNSMPGGTSS